MPLQLIINWSEQLASLLETHGHMVDGIKIPTLTPPPSHNLKNKTILLHGLTAPYRIMQPDIPKLEELREWIALTKTPYLSVHLDAKISEDHEVLSNVEDIIEQICNNVIALKQATGLHIALENCVYYPWGKLPRQFSDPQFIGQVIQASGADFLLDIAHARVSAAHRQEEISQYLAKLPLDRVREIHISGPRLQAEGLRDQHNHMLEIDYQILQQVIPQAKQLQTITLEYGGTPPTTRNLDGSRVAIDRNNIHELAVQIEKLYAICQNH